MMTGVDPLLYRNHGSELEQKLGQVKQAGAEASGSSFDDILNQKMDSKLRATISSDDISPVPGKQEILKHIGNDKGRRKLYEAAEEFEGYFLEKMFREMKKNVPKSGLIDGGFAEEIFDEMLTTERVGAMAHSMEFGLAETIYSQLQRFSADRK